MRKLLLVFFALLSAYGGFAQCAASFTTAAAPLNNNLLRIELNNTTTTGTIPTGGYANAFMIWGDGTGNNIGLGGLSYHNYPSAGTYTGTLIVQVVDSVFSALVCSDTFTNTITVAYTPCATSFTVTKSGSNPLMVTVNATNPAGTSGMSYSWNWGDGTTAGSGATTTHTYASGGIYTITLNASATGCSYSNAGPIYIPGSCSSFVPNFTSSVATSTVTFTNTSTISGAYTRSSSWFFGDGGTSSLSNPLHRYFSIGTFSVLLVNTWVDTLTSAYCFDSVVHSITIDSLTNEIVGNITLDSPAIMPYPEFNVWLIDFDSVSNILSSVDSIHVTGDAAGINTPFSFTNHPAGIYRTKAQLTNGPTTGIGAVPTYHWNSLLWSTAQLIYHSGASSSGDIYMQNGTITSGPGFISGNVSAGANKGTADGIPGMTILLLDAAGKPVTYAVTDANGDYNFGHLAPAAYTVYPEDPGFNTTSVGLTVLNNDPTFKDINFSRSLSKHSITPNTTRIIIDNKPVDFAIFPNPAKNKVFINSNKTTAAVTITDIAGKKVMTATLTSGKTELNLGDLQKGLYFITLEADNQKTTQKLLLQ